MAHVHCFQKSLGFRNASKDLLATAPVIVPPGREGDDSTELTMTSIKGDGRLLLAADLILERREYTNPRDVEIRAS